MSLLNWLPITKKETELRGWDEVDVVIITGDAYVDHPSFGAAVIGRVLEREGYRVALIPQPNWRDDLRDFKKFGRPRLFFGISAGAMDSMVNHYTANKRLRSDDAYTPGGQAGFRPDRATIVYSNILKQLYPDVPVVIGGIEASLRRVTHYDYWDDCLKPSILVDSHADLGVYGMGELGIVEIARALSEGKKISKLTNIPQTFFLSDKQIESEWQDIELVSHEVCLKNKKLYASNFRHIEEESNKKQAARLVQQVGGKTLYINPPYPTMTEAQIDASFDLPYTRLPHPKYDKRGVIPAYEMIRHSVNLHRGCFGGCAFCTISAHQGKFVASRSKESIMREVDKVVEMEDFKGYISDLGGPSANMYKMHGKDESRCAKCARPSCIQPSVCPNLITDHHPLIDIYKTVDNHPKVKKATIGSGIRYDLFLSHDDKEENKAMGYDEYFRQLVTRHVSGRLKVAPEHTSDAVLKRMRKPNFEMFVRLKKKFDRLNEKEHLNQQLIPYFISSHPDCYLEDMADLAVKTASLGYRLEQVQDFTPTPMTLATEVYYSGYDPYTLEPVFVAKSKEDKLAQRRFFFWYLPENREWVKSTLRKTGHLDWIKQLYNSSKR